MPRPRTRLRLCFVFVALIIGAIVLPTARGANAVQGRVVVNIGGLGTWDGYAVSRPFVLYNGSSYMMWYSGESVYNIDYIGLAISTDGITWSRYSQNPVLNVGDVGTWDHGRVRDAWIIHENGIYKMWYTGVLYMAFTKVIVAEQVGYATSPDGMNWTKYSGNPVLRYGPTGSLNDKWVFRPVVISTGSSYTMYYSSLSQTDTYGIGMATSKDGISWTKLNPLTLPSSGWDAYAPAVGSIMKIGNTLVMAYSAQTSQPSPPQIGLANSTDGNSWATFPKNPVITSSGSSAWDNEGVSDPMIVNVGDHYSVYYTGSANNGTSRIGLATLPKTQIAISELSANTFVAIVGIILTAFSLLRRRKLTLRSGGGV